MPNDTSIAWDRYSEDGNTFVAIGTSINETIEYYFYDALSKNKDLKYILVSESYQDATNRIGKWYQYSISDNGLWVPVNDLSSINQSEVKSSLYSIQLSQGDDPTLGNYVSIAPKDRQYAINTQSSSSNMESYKIAYFRVVKSYIPKSWTQRIEFIKSPNVREIKNIDYYTDPNLEGMSPALDSHVVHQYNGYAWLEDYHYAFDDAQTSSSIGSASSVNVVGASPNDEDYKIPAIKDGKAYNPNYSYNYIWQEDSQYNAWDNPIVVLDGNYTNPYDVGLSVYSLDQHVINPNYISGYEWVSIYNKPSDANDFNTISFSGTNSSTPPSWPASLTKRLKNMAITQPQTHGGKFLLF